MARMTEQQLIDAAVNALPQDGSEMPFEDFAAALDAQGARQALEYMKHLKANGKVKTSLTFNPETQEMRHTVRLINP